MTMTAPTTDQPADRVVGPEPLPEPLGDCGGQCEFLEFGSERPSFPDRVQAHNDFMEVLNSGDWLWALQELGFAERRRHEDELHRKINPELPAPVELVLYQLPVFAREHNFTDPVGVARFVNSLDIFLLGARHHVHRRRRVINGPVGL